MFGARDVEAWVFRRDRGSYSIIYIDTLLNIINSIKYLTLNLLYKL